MNSVNKQTKNDRGLYFGRSCILEFRLRCLYMRHFRHPEWRERILFESVSIARRTEFVPPKDRPMNILLKNRYPFNTQSLIPARCWRAQFHPSLPIRGQNGVVETVVFVIVCSRFLRSYDKDQQWFYVTHARKGVFPSRWMLIRRR